MDEKKRNDLLRTDIGMRSPFALAGARLKTQIPWRELSTEAAKGYLYKAFHIEYSRLFDPDIKYRSPLYPREGREVLKAGSGKEYLLRRRTGATPCTASVARWATLDWTYPAPPPPASSTSPGGPYGIDVMQGCAADCYFVAALSSVAWTSPTLLQGKPDTSSPPRHKYKFYAPAATSNLKVGRSIAVDAGDGIVFAHPMDGDSVWPSVYEKAYAVFRKIQPVETPDITQLNTGNPATTLFEITGLPIDARFVREFSPERLFEFISTKCGGAGVAGRTLCPLVTWTYHDSTCTPRGDRYEDDLIPADHSFSILGTGYVDDRPCIVLRNPFGISVADPVKEGIAEWDWASWTPSSHLSPAPPGDPPVRPRDGNFAMEVEAFTRYFEAVGHIV
ncbi:MAG: C2 family cysteine protease [Methanomicrobiales archaeon]|nr:C2 family cysteine protease [Methanomicrobiales archaeon]